MNPAALLLSDPSPALRLRVLTELLAVPVDDDEALDLRRRRDASDEVRELVAQEPADLPALADRLGRFAYLGLDREHPRVRALAERLLAEQQPDGSFPLAAFRSDERYTMAPLQTAIPVRALASVGYAEDARLEWAIEWLLACREDDGSWSPGRAAGQPARVPGYRRLIGARGCRSTTVGVAAALARHPGHRHGRPARAAVDLLLQQDSREEAPLGTEVARQLGAEPADGFLTRYARPDLALLAELVSACDVDGDRAEALLAALLTRRGRLGLWTHPSHPQLSRWLSFDLLRSLGGRPQAPAQAQAEAEAEA